MTARRVRVAGARIGAENGITLTEMLVVMVILLVVFGGMLTLFLSASQSQIDQTNRVDAQLNTRLALDSLRRELRCASGVTAISGSSVTIMLPGYCQKPATTSALPFTWCAPESSAPYSLRRYAGSTCSGTGVEKADSLTSNAIFTYNRLASQPRPVIGTPVLGASVDNGYFSLPTYAYVVTAVTSAGEISGEIKPVPIGTAGTPNQITLTWSSVPGATTYHVYGRDDGTFTNEGLRRLASTTLLTYTDMGCATPAANCLPAVVLDSSRPSPPLATIGLNLEVRVTTSGKTGRFRLQDDVVLRNSGRY